jgi:hypothetical protein
MQFRYTDLNTPSSAEVASLTAANATDLNTLRSAIIPAFARAMLDLRARILAIAGNPRNSAQAMADDTAQARSEAATQIEQIEGRAQDAAGRIYARLDKATEGAPDVQQAAIRSAPIGARRHSIVGQVPRLQVQLHDIARNRVVADKLLFELQPPVFAELVRSLHLRAPTAGRVPSLLSPRRKRGLSRPPQSGSASNAPLGRHARGRASRSRRNA